MDRGLLIGMVLLAGCVDAPGVGPTVVLQEPVADAVVPVGLEVALFAQATRGAGPLVALGWSSDRDGDIAFAEPDDTGFGATTGRFETVGEHVLTVTAFDGLGGEGTDSIELRVRTATAPFLEILSPWGGTELFEGDPLALIAEVQDVEHPAEELRVAWSRDGEVIFTDLVPDEDGLASASLTAVQGAWTFAATVVDPDGMQTAADVGVSIGPPNTLPTCGIEQPSADVWHRDLPVTFEFSAADAESDTADLAWSLESSVDGPLGTGTGDDLALTISLSEAQHTVTLTVVDPGGQQCTATKDLLLRDCDGDADGFIDAVCGGEDCDDTSAAVGPFAGDVLGDGVDSDCDGLDCGAGAASDGTYFAACFEGLDQPAAIAACVDAGYPGLASIRDADEEQFVMGLTAGSERMWIGLHNGTGAWWSWLDGSSAFYRRWAPGEPNMTTFPACAEISSFQAWADQPCETTDAALGFVCALRP